MATDDKPVIADIATAAIRATWPCRAGDDFSRYAMTYQLIRPVPSGGVLVMATNGHILGCYHDEQGFAPEEVLVQWPRGLWRIIRKGEPPLTRIIVNADAEVVSDDASWHVAIGQDVEFPPVDRQVAAALAGVEANREKIQCYASALLAKISEVAFRALKNDIYGTTAGLAIMPSGDHYQAPSLVLAPLHPQVFWLVMPLRQAAPLDLSATCLRFFGETADPLGPHPETNPDNPYYGHDFAV